MWPKQFSSSHIPKLHGRRSCCARTWLSVDSENVALDLVAQLSLQVAQLLLENSQRWHDDGLRSQRATWLHVIKEPVQEDCLSELLKFWHMLHFEQTIYNSKQRSTCCTKIIFWQKKNLSPLTSDFAVYNNHKLTTCLQTIVCISSQPT